MSRLMSWAAHRYPHQDASLLKRAFPQNMSRNSKSIWLEGQAIQDTMMVIKTKSSQELKAQLPQAELMQQNVEQSGSFGVPRAISCRTSISNSIGFIAQRGRADFKSAKRFAGSCGSIADAKPPHKKMPPTCTCNHEPGRPCKPPSFASQFMCRAITPGVRAGLRLFFLLLVDALRLRTLQAFVPICPRLSP